MAINKKLIHFKNKTKFLTELANNNILNTSIVFIQDTNEIWTHGTFYPCPYSKEEIDQIISDIKGTASDEYNSLGKIEAIVSSIESQIDNKVDKVTDKGLSTNDYTTAEKNKLSGIQAGAQLNTITGVKGNAESTYRTGLINITKANIGLGNVNNTSDRNKPISDATYTALNKKPNFQVKSDDTINLDSASVVLYNFAGSDLYPVTLLNNILDFPKDGGIGKLLTHDGTNPVWKDYSDFVFNTLSYGVEWDTEVADPKLTRIGNLEYHKTLPIQSGMKGCVYDNKQKKVVYWLHDRLWPLMRDAKDIKKLNKYDNYGTILWAMLNSNDLVCFRPYILSDDMYKRLAIPGTYFMEHAVWDRLYVSLGVTPEPEGAELGLAWIKCKYIGRVGTRDNDVDGEWWLEIHSNLSGYDGEVMVYVPEFWIKSWEEDTKRSVRIAVSKIDDSWEHQPAVFVSAYRNTILNKVPENMGYLSTLPVDSAISVANEETYCRGGLNDASGAGTGATFDKYLTGEDGTTIDKFRTFLGKPRTMLSRSDARKYCNINNTNLMSYDLYKNIFYWLYVIEYANFDCQAEYNKELTTEGYHLGGLGAGVTGIDSANVTQYNGLNPITPCGYGDLLGNRTGTKAISTTFTKTDGSEVTISVLMPRWRGFDNPFGDIMTMLDGVIVDNQSTDINWVYTCQDPTKFSDTLDNNYKKVGEQTTASGNIKQFDLGSNAHIIAKTVGGNTGEFKCDMLDGRKVNLGIPMVGGPSFLSSEAGISCTTMGSNTDADSATYIGFRSVSQP